MGEQLDELVCLLKQHRDDYAMFRDTDVRDMETHLRRRDFPRIASAAVSAEYHDGLHRYAESLLMSIDTG